MTTYSIDEAGTALPNLIDRAIAGEDVVLVREGQPVAEIRPTTAAKPFVIGSHEWLFSRTVTPPHGTPTSVELLNMIYEDSDT
jgi:antitoxin (DNA-binding transcriptional repressor) of toxin-antitoxin stability system